MSSWFSKQDIDLKSLKEFDNHRLVSFIYDEKTNLTGVVAIHRTNKGVPSFGATRMWNYASTSLGVADALRLSRLMSYKAALAGLPCGGAKAVIFEQPEYLQDEKLRAAALAEYATKLNLLGGSFVTGTDVGIKQSELMAMREHSTQIVGFNDNTTEFTGLGLFESVKTSLKEAFGSDDPSERRFAIQGLGKVGGALLDNLAPLVGPKGAIYVSEINEARLNELQQKYPQIKAVTPEIIHLQEVDVFSPCALGGAINPKTVKEIKAKIVVGGANNQLAQESMGDSLFARNILYAPDYVANSGGLIAVFDEYQHPESYDASRVREKVLHISKSLEEIFSESKEKHMAPHRIANEQAERIFNAYE